MTEHNDSEKKYSGYGYHGGGRKKTGRIKQFKTFSVSLPQEDYEELMRAFESSGEKSRSRFIFGCVTGRKN